MWYVVQKRPEALIVLSSEVTETRGGGVIQEGRLRKRPSVHATKHLPSLWFQSFFAGLSVQHRCTWFQEPLAAWELRSHHLDTELYEGIVLHPG